MRTFGIGIIGFFLGCGAMFLFMQIQYPYVSGIPYGDDRNDEEVSIRINANDHANYPHSVYTAGGDDNSICIKLYPESFNGPMYGCE